MVNGGDGPTGTDAEDDSATSVFEMMIGLWQSFAPPEASTESNAPLNPDSAVDDSDTSDRAPFYESAVGPEHYPAPGWLSAPPKPIELLPNLADEEAKWEARQQAEWDAQDQRRFEQEELDERLDDLIREFDQSRTSAFERPPGWMRMWWWARLFGVEDRMEDYLNKRRQGIRIGDAIEQPTDDEVFGDGDIPSLDTDQPERLIAIVNFFERIDPSNQIEEAPLPYLLVREFTLGSYRETLDQIYRAFEALAAPKAEANDSGQAIEPPSMTPERPDVDRAEGPDFADLEDHDYPVPDVPRDDDEDDDDESGPVPFNPPKLELDPGTVPKDPDWAVDDSDTDDRDFAILDRPVGAKPAPRPLRPGDGTGRRLPTGPTPEGASPTPDTTGPPEDGRTAEPRPAPVDTNQNSRDSIVDPPELEFDASEPEPTDSAVDDSGPTGRRGRGRGLDIAPFTPPDPPPPSTTDSAPDDSDGVTPLASTGSQAGGGMLGSPRRKVLVGVAALLLLAAVATVGLAGDSESPIDDFAIAPTPNASATAETGTAVDPTALPTEEPAMTIAPVPELIICSNDPSASFSGFVQPDGTVLDADTGEPRACPGSDN